MEPSGSADAQDGPVFGGYPIVPPHRFRLPAASSLLNRKLGRRPIPSSMLPLSISLPPKLRMTPAETDHMPLYLRTFVRLLSSWVHNPSRPTTRSFPPPPGRNGSEATVPDGGLTADRSAPPKGGLDVISPRVEVRCCEMSRRAALGLWVSSFRFTPSTDPIACWSHA